MISMENFFGISKNEPALGNNQLMRNVEIEKYHFPHIKN